MSKIRSEFRVRARGFISKIRVRGIARVRGDVSKTSGTVHFIFCNLIMLLRNSRVLDAQIQTLRKMKFLFSKNVEISCKICFSYF